jgi:peptidoglycan/LPS O-acetylase OafA/YrhL
VWLEGASTAPTWPSTGAKIGRIPRDPACAKSGTFPARVSPPSDAPKKPGFFALSLLANHFPQLHGIRVLAIVLVVQFHVTFALIEARLPISQALGTWSATVFFGMDLFFVLSGFLIGTMILHSLSQSSRQHVLRFYARRSFRIFPLYYVTLVALLFIYPVTPERKANLVYEFAYLTNYLPVLRHTVVMSWGWSLCVEEHFYLIVPVLMALLHALKSHWARLGLLGVLWISALFVRLVIFAKSPVPWNEVTFSQALYIKTHTRYDTLVAGIVLAYVQYSFPLQVKALLARRAVRVVFWLVSGTCLLVLLSPWAFPNLYVGRLISWGTVTSIMYLPFLLLMMNVDSRLSRWLSAGAFLRIATLGYGIYMWHVPVCEKLIVPLSRLMFGRLQWPMSVVWVVTLVLLLVVTTGAAYLTHVLVEKPALWLRDKVAG